MASADAKASPGNGRMPPGFRELPHNIEAEQALLGAIMINNHGWHAVSTMLRPEHFYEPVHGRIYASIDRLMRAGIVADPITLRNEFEQDEALEELDGAQYLSQLALAAESVVNVPDYARIVVDTYAKRGIIAAAEDATNHAYNGSYEPSSTILDRLSLSVRELNAEANSTKGKPKSVDWIRVANRETHQDRWLVQDWIPAETAGVFGGPGGGGKSFLQMMLMICLASGRPFLGMDLEAVPCIGLFAEESQAQLEARATMICDGLNVDPETLRGRCDFRSMFGVAQPLFEAERFGLSVTPTAWFDELTRDAKAMGEHTYVMLDHVLKLMTVNRNEPGQVFSLFGYLNEMAAHIGGAVCLLSHPSKADLRAGTGPQVGGCHAMLDAPRWCWLLASHKDELTDEKYRTLTLEKVNALHGSRRAMRLQEGSHGLVEPVADMDPDDVQKRAKRTNGAGRPSAADKTFGVLQELYHTHRRPIAIDEIVADCIRRGIVAEAVSGTHDWRDRRRSIRRHLERVQNRVEERDTDFFCVLPT